VTAVPFGVEQTDRRTASERWRAVPVGWRVVVVAVAVVVAVELASSFVTGISGGAPAGDQASSSFGTGPSGVAAMAQLLTDRGHRVVEEVRPLPDVAFPPGSTLFVIDPASWSAADTASVVRLTRSGGRAVVVGQPPSAGLTRQLFAGESVPRWVPRPSGVAVPTGTSSLTTGLSSVSSGPSGSFSATPGTTVLAGPGGALATSPDRLSPAPTAALVASNKPLSNAMLARRDNAAFALNLAGPASRTVVFDEYDHGYGRSGTGLAGLPRWWRWGLGTALLAIIVWMLSASRRFGPVEPAARALVPPRVDYIDALASVLGARRGDRLTSTVAPLRAEGRHLLCRRAGVRDDAPDGEVVAAARAARLPEEVIDALTGPGSASSSEAVRAGRAVAWLESRRGGSP